MFFLFDFFYKISFFYLLLLSSHRKNIKQRMDKQPELMNYSRMKGVYDAHLDEIQKHAFINNELGMFYGDPSIILLILQRHKPPFTINDFRMGLIAQGHARIRINLVDKDLMPGMFLFIGPGTIVHPVSYTKNLEIYGIGLFDDFPMPQLPSAFNGQVRDFQVKVSEDAITTARHIIDTLWHLVHQPDYNRQTVSCLVAALMHLYDGAYHRHTDILHASQSREQTIFDYFIQLANQHCAEQHQIGFYADRLCLTKRYLSTVIRQTSGVTAKEWIDRALIARIKVELIHTDKTILQISDELNFTNPSFFSKYFKRITGITPGEFRMG